MRVTHTSLLFVCTFYGARSLIAHEYAQQYCSAHIDTQYCCFEHGPMSPAIFALLNEAGFNPPILPKIPTLFDLLHQQKSFDFVIVLCQPTSTEDCQSVLSIAEELVRQAGKILLWSTNDFLSLSKPGAQQWLRQARLIRDGIEQNIDHFFTHLMALSEYSD